MLITKSAHNLGSPIQAQAVTSRATLGNVKPWRIIKIMMIIKIILPKGDPKCRNDGMAERRNGGITEWRKTTPNPKRWNRRITERRKIPPIPKRRNHGTAERRKIPQNPKRRNNGKSPEILKDGIAEKQPKS